MTDPLARELAERVAAATPIMTPPFDKIRRRARRHRARTALAATATAAAVAGVAAVSWTLGTSDPNSHPGNPASTPSSTGESTPSRPEPTYSPSEHPSGLVVRLNDRDIDLPADTSCWTGSGNCRRGLLLPSDPGPDVGSGDAVDFWFARPDWTFSATFRREGEECPRATTVKAVPTDSQWFRLTPADQAGRYEVELYGEGPEGLVSTRFLWTTTSDGPVDPPKGAVALFPESRGEGSYALEVIVDDLAFHPMKFELSRSVEVAVTAVDGSEQTLTAPLIADSLLCGGRGSKGSFYYQREWDEDFSVLGQSPFDLEVTLTIRGTTYVGHATWRDVQGGPVYTPVTFTPPLPAAGGD